MAGSWIEEKKGIGSKPLSFLFVCFMAQNEYHKTLKTKKHGSTVVVQMIKYVQKIIMEMWYGRNDALHKNENSRVNKRKSNEYNLLIDALYQRKRTIPIRLLAQADRKYFRQEMQALKRMWLASKERWVNPFLTGCLFGAYLVPILTVTAYISCFRSIFIKVKPNYR